MKTILVVFGGRSAEHDVSIITAHTPIIASLEAGGEYEILPLYISRDNKWYCEPELNKLDFFKTPGWTERLAKFKSVQLDLSNGLSIIWPGIRPKQVRVDVVFPALHGTYGEDGSLMGLLRMAGVPFVGCDLAASAVAMDKVLTKQVAEINGISVVPYVWFSDTDWGQDAEAVLVKIKKLSYPLFVKPVHLGSSIGISKVSDAKALVQAIEVALHYDDKVIVEEGVSNLIEVTLPIIGNDEPRAGLVERPLNKTEFFDFNDKYLGQGKGAEGANNQYSELPADIDKKLYDQAMSVGLSTYRVLGLSGIARIDMLINSRTNQVYLNEVNTLPGSLYHHNWRAAGVSGVELVMTLINLAEERQAKLNEKTYIFDSTILQQAGGAKT